MGGGSNRSGRGRVDAARHLDFLALEEDDLLQQVVIGHQKERFAPVDEILAVEVLASGVERPQDHTLRVQRDAPSNDVGLREERGRSDQDGKETQGEPHHHLR